VQDSVESILKQKVRDNYKVFLHANDEITRVGKEMIDLNNLILYTQELIKDISLSRKKESSPTALRLKDKDNEQIDDGFMSLSVKYGEVSKDNEALQDIPIHVRKAPDDLVRN
jgi:hypothetical protein